MNSKKHIPIEASICMTLFLFILLFAPMNCQAGIPEATNRQYRVRVVLDDNYPPYVFKDDQGHLKGIIVDQWGLWEKKTGIPVELTGMDWGNAQLRMQAGEFDVIDTIFKNEKRDQIYEFSKPYAQLEVPLFFHVDISGIRGPDDLKGFLVAAKAGDNSIEILKKHGVTTIAEYPSYEKLIEAARDGKVKVFTVDRPPALYFLNKMGIQGSFRETKPLYHGEFHRAVRRGNTNLLKVVEDGFARITKADYETVDKRWMGSPISATAYLRYALYSLGVISSIALLLTAWLWILKRAVSRKTLELSKSEDHHRAILQTAMSGIWQIDTRGRLLEVNNTYCRMSGYSEQELLARSVSDLDANETPEETAERIQQIIQRGEDHFETRHMRKDGTVFEVEVSVQYRPDNGGQCVAFLQDITCRKQAEKENLALAQQLQQTQKLESLGVLAGGIAHDFNNILMAIMGNAGLALMHLGTDSPAAENLHQIELAADKAAKLAQQMLAYTGKGKLDLKTIDLSGLVAEMTHMIEISISNKAILHFNLDKDLPAVTADATQLNQIIMNLVINASEAIGDKIGTIAITTGVMNCDKSYLKTLWLNEEPPEGMYVFLEVSDTGCGMDTETAARVFDPFFTTKFTGRGLGMAAVFGIVRGHKGTIKVYSEPGKGTTFKVLLPASNKSLQKESSGYVDDGWMGRGKVLLVDDEETIRDIGKQMLLLLGFEVILAEDGYEALSFYKEDETISLVILDLTMPRMSGEDAFRELRRMNPELKIIMSSGYNEQEVTQKFAGKELTGFIQKPYSLDGLKTVLKKVG